MIWLDWAQALLEVGGTQIGDLRRRIAHRFHHAIELVMRQGYLAPVGLDDLVGLVECMPAKGFRDNFESIDNCLNLSIALLVEYLCIAHVRHLRYFMTRFNGQYEYDNVNKCSHLLLAKFLYCFQRIALNDEQSGSHRLQVRIEILFICGLVFSLSWRDRLYLETLEHELGFIRPKFFLLALPLDVHQVDGVDNVGRGQSMSQRLIVMEPKPLAK